MSLLEKNREPEWDYYRDIGLKRSKRALREVYGNEFELLHVEVR